ncbi:MAG: polysaccharide deacetylase family protein [Lachnospiraceae bacterium]|nr:polysaccharide deacetylase family protein [Lachnospiraceae bacterium]
MKRWRSALTVLILCGAFVGLSGKILYKCESDRIPATGTSSAAEESENAHTTSVEEKRIALTFDDGPHPIYTPQMLEVLAQENVPATFFLLGENVELYGDIVKEIAAQGHLIGNHTWHHVQITTLSLEEARAEILETSELIEELTGQGTEYVRPPFGTWNPVLEDDLDLIPVMWSIDTLDWTTENVDQIVEQVAEEASENDIILMHDSYESTVQAVERIIPLLQAEGFEFVTVDQVIMD